MRSRFILSQASLLTWMVSVLLAMPAQPSASEPPAILTTAYKDGRTDESLVDYLKSVLAEALPKQSRRRVQPDGKPAQPDSPTHGALELLTERAQQAGAGSVVELEMMCAQARPTVKLWMFILHPARPAEQLRPRELDCPPAASGKSQAFRQEDRDRLVLHLTKWLEENPDWVTFLPAGQGVSAAASPPPDDGEIPAGAAGPAMQLETLSAVTKPTPAKKKYDAVFKAGVALTATGVLLTIPAGILTALAGNPAGTCTINDTQPLSGPDCVISRWPGPVLFGVAGAAAAAGSGLLIYWGVHPESRAIVKPAGGNTYAP